MRFSARSIPVGRGQGAKGPRGQDLSGLPENARGPQLSLVVEVMSDARTWRGGRVGTERHRVDRVLVSRYLV